MGNQLTAASAALLLALVAATAMAAWPSSGRYAGTGGGATCTAGQLDFTKACDTAWAL
jgi:hypothetical protein